MDADKFFDRAQRWMETTTGLTESRDLPSLPNSGKTGAAGHTLVDTLKHAASEAIGRVMEAPLCRFHLDVAGLGEEALAVESFQSSGVALSSLGRFDVEVLARIEPALGTLLGEAATLRISSPTGQDSIIALQVEAITELAASLEGARLRLSLVSPLYPLALNRHNRVFLYKDLAQIIEQVMLEAGFNGDDIDIDFASPQPARDMVVQYEESDLDFLQRLLAREGAFYAVNSSSRGACYLFRDNSTELSEAMGSARLEYHPHSGQDSDSERIFQISRTLRWDSATVQLRDYNPKTPDRSPHGQAEGLGGSGEQDYWGPNSTDAEQAQALAKIRIEAIDAERQTVTARADTAHLLPGMQLVLDGHPEYLGVWLVTAVALQGDQRVGHAFGQNSDRPGLESRLSLLPVSVPFRSNAAWRRDPVHGSFSAVVEGDGSDYAYLDDQGRYRLRLPFDLSDADTGEATPPVRLMQPYGGAGSGMHLPLHAGTEVLLSCVNGDIDRPVILGALSNPDTPSPVTGANPSQHLLRTRGGNELLMEDRAGEERIELFTGERKNRLSLDARNDGHQITLASDEGDMEITAGGHMSCEVGASQNVQVGENQTVTVTRDLRLMTREGQVELQAGTDLLFKATDNLRLSADKEDIHLRAGRDLITRSKGDTAMEVVNGDANLVVPRGDLGMDVKGAVTIRGAGKAALCLSQGGGTIEISPSGDLIIDGGAVEISGGSIKVDGQQVGSN